MFNFSKNKNIKRYRADMEENLREIKAAVPTAYNDIIDKESKAHTLTGARMLHTIKVWKDLIASESIESSSAAEIDLVDIVRDLETMNPEAWSQRWALSLLLQVVAMGVIMEKVATNPADYELLRSTHTEVLKEEQQNEAEEEDL